MDFVDIDLAGRTYKLRYTWNDVQDVCRRLTSFQPAGQGKVTPTTLGTLLLNLDPDAFQFLLWAGLRHVAEFSKIDPADAQRMMDRAVQAGQQAAKLRLPIFRGLVACGLADFAPILKILEEAEEQEARDAAFEVEADSGNGSRPSSLSPTTSLRPPSPPSESLMSRDG